MYTTKEAAEKLGLSADHVKLLARKGKMAAKKAAKKKGMKVKRKY